MSQTKAQIRDRAGQMLSVIQTGGTLQHQDKVLLEQYYSEVYAELKEDGLNIWASTGSVPDELASHVTALVAEKGLDNYSVSDSRYQRIILAAGKAKREIPKFVQPEYEGLDTPTDY